MSLFSNPQHPYTQALLASILTPEPNLGIPEINLGTTFSNLLDPPSGCNFHPRCSKTMPICSQVVPLRREQSGGVVACHLYEADTLDLKNIEQLYAT